MKTEDWLTLSVIYRTKSLSSAAKELFISQPALTIRLQNIEKEVGCQIAIRSNKGLLRKANIFPRNLRKSWTW